MIGFSGDQHIGNNFSDWQKSLKNILTSIQINKPSLFILLGDLFDKSSTAIQRKIASQFVADIDKICPVHILRGNHDGIDDIQFLRPWVTISIEPEVVLKGSFKFLALPYKKWQSVDEIKQTILSFSDYDFICLHGQIETANMDNNYIPKSLPDIIPIDFLKSLNKPVFAGHYHKHQVLSENPLILYTGSPARSSFGDVVEEKGIVYYPFKFDVLEKSSVLTFHTKFSNGNFEPEIPQGIDYIKICYTIDRADKHKFQPKNVGNKLTKWSATVLKPEKEKVDLYIPPIDLLGNFIKDHTDREGILSEFKQIEEEVYDDLNTHIDLTM